MEIAYEKLSPNHSGQRVYDVTRITPHCIVGQWSAKQIGDYFLNASVNASCNYGIGKYGDIALCVPESFRSWCSSSRENDQRAITIECASDTKDPYAINDYVLTSLRDLMLDICRRYDKTSLIWLPTKNQRLAYQTKNDEMLITLHRDFAKKACPGEFLISKLPDMCEQITRQLSTPEKPLYHVQTGAFRNKSKAESYADMIEQQGFDTYVRWYEGLYHVQVGAFANIMNAKIMEDKLKANGFSTFITTK